MAVKVSPAFIGLAERAMTPAEAPFGYGEVTIQEQGQFDFIIAQKVLSLYPLKNKRNA